jgi:hypothetical protein
MMSLLPVTLATAGALGLVYLVLSVRVVRGRFTNRVSLGDGGQPVMQRRIRAHGNFGEYVPFLLILMALLEASGASHVILAGAGIALVIGRISHAIGIEIPKAPNPYRFIGGLITFGMLLIGSIWALARALG